MARGRQAGNTSSHDPPAGRGARWALHSAAATAQGVRQYHARGHGAASRSGRTAGPAGAAARAAGLLTVRAQRARQRRPLQASPAGREGRPAGRGRHEQGALAGAWTQGGAAGAGGPGAGAGRGRARKKELDGVWQDNGRSSQAHPRDRAPRRGGGGSNAHGRGAGASPESAARGGGQPKTGRLPSGHASAEGRAEAGCRSIVKQAAEPRRRRCQSRGGQPVAA